MKLSLHRWLSGLALAGLIVVTAIGCAGPRGGNRLFASHRAQAAPAPEGAHVADGQVPLPSQQGVRPASVQMPPAGHFSEQNIQALRSGRPVGLFAPPGRSCHS